MQTHESLARDLMRLFIWFPFRWLTLLLPVRTSLWLMKMLGVVHHTIARKRAARILGCMRVAGCTISPSTTLMYFVNHYVDRLHIFLYPKLDSKRSFERIVTFKNIEVLTAALAQGKGAILVQPHFGPVQLTLLALKLQGCDPVQIGYQSDKGLSPIGRSVAFKYRIKYEAMLPPILNADKFLGAAYRHLKGGGVMLTTGDGAGGGVYIGEHDDMGFLGTTRKFPLGPATWATKTGAAYIPTYIVTETHDRFSIIFGEPISVKHADSQLDRIHLTERFIESFELMLKAHPHCWHFWDELAQPRNKH